MKRLLLFSAIFEIIHCSCPSGLDLVRDGECRGQYATNKEETSDGAVNRAIAKCKEIQAKPVIIHNDEHQAYWKTEAKSTTGVIIIAIWCNDTSRRYQWADGSDIDYTPKDGYDSSLFEPCLSTDGYSWTITSSGDGEWGRGHDSICPNHNNDFTAAYCCTTLLQAPVRAGHGCDDYEDNTEAGACYQIYTAGANWTEAQATCMKNGANLASVHNLEENSYIRRLAVSNGAVNGLFLGAMAETGNNFQWIDGSEWDYNYFYPSLPVESLGKCLSLDTLGTTGQWVNTDCSSKLPFACIRKQRDIMPLSQCSSGPWKEEEIITSPGFPYDSSTPCEYILTVDIGKKVQVEIQLLEANSCCDRLILMDNIVGGNIVANLTGEYSNVIYTTQSSNMMRVSWQPTNGVNVRGLQMMFRTV